MKGTESGQQAGDVPVRSAAIVQSMGTVEPQIWSCWPDAKPSTSRLNCRVMSSAQSEQLTPYGLNGEALVPTPWSTLPTIWSGNRAAVTIVGCALATEGTSTSRAPG